MADDTTTRPNARKLREGIVTSAGMDKTAEELKARTKRFAVAVLDFVDTLPRTPSGDAVARQLARSGLGVAGNYRGACRGRSSST